jgi:hypothetical protein
MAKKGKTEIIAWFLDEKKSLKVAKNNNIRFYANCGRLKLLSVACRGGYLELAKMYLLSLCFPFPNTILSNVKLVFEQGKACEKRCKGKWRFWW